MSKLVGASPLPMKVAIFDINGVSGLFGNEYRDSAGCTVPVVFVGRKSGDADVPESGPFLGVFHFSNTHIIDGGLVADLYVGVRPEIVHPYRIRGRPAPRSNEDVVVAVLDAHQRRLADGAGAVTLVCHDYYGQSCLAQGRALRAAASFVQFDLFADPV